MSQVFDIANAYVERSAALDPYAATMRGIAGHDHEATDYSPDGLEQRARLSRDTIALLDATDAENDAERLARDAMRDRLASALELHEAGEDLRNLNVLRPPSGTVRQVFDLMPKQSEDDWRAVAARLLLVPAALDGYVGSLREGLRRETPSAVRQAIEVAQQAETWSGNGEPERSFFHRLVAGFDGSRSASLAAELARGADAAAAAYAGFASFLRAEYAPRAAPLDGVGEERYRRFARQYLGIDIEPRETYAWGWDELRRLRVEMQATAARIVPGATAAEAVRFLNTEPSRAIEGEDAYRAWLQDVHDEAVSALTGVHFEIDPRIRKIEVMIPPPGGALAPYYTGPSEDFSRPGRTWWPLGSSRRFPKWDRVTIAYHEGVPGHHLQVGGAACLGERLSRYQRTMLFVSGHGEGWALYAERLMAELGFLEDPDYYLGMLGTQAFRAARVIVDIGMHLGLAVPAGEDFHAGETWTPELAQEFIVRESCLDPEFMASEIVRYLGNPAQAISYKVGEREWLRVREAARSRFGAAFDLKRFHTAALDLGPLPLSMLQPEVERALAS